MNTAHRPTPDNDLIDAPELNETTRSGRATWDDRGNTVWEWQTSPGIYSREVTSHQLQTLQAVELSLMEVSSHRISSYTNWKHQYQDRFTPAPLGETELVMPIKRKEKVVAGMFDAFLKKLRLPA